MSWQSRPIRPYVRSNSFLCTCLLSGGGVAPEMMDCGARLFVNHCCPRVFDEKLRSTSMFEGLFQPMHLLMIFGIALLVFGPKKLPELGKGLGESIRGFKAAMKTDEEKPASITTTVAGDQDATKG